MAFICVPRSIISYLQLLQRNSTPVANGHRRHYVFDPSYRRIIHTLLTVMIFRHPKYHLGLSDVYCQLYLARPNPWTVHDATVHRQPFIIYHSRILTDLDVYYTYRKHDKNMYNTYRKHLHMFPFDYDMNILQIYIFLIEITDVNITTSSYGLVIELYRCFTYIYIFSWMGHKVYSKRLFERPFHIAIKHNLQYCLM